MTTKATPTEIDLRLLQLLANEPTLSQRQLADRLGVSLGKTNYCLKALKEKGWVKWERFVANPNKLQCLHAITSKGLQQKLSLTLHFLERKQAEFEYLKEEIAALWAEIEGQKAAESNIQDSKTAGKARDKHLGFLGSTRSNCAISRKDRVHDVSIPISPNNWKVPNRALSSKFGRHHF
jgi:EPS-associated MarR family transcriptional regulator